MIESYSECHFIALKIPLLAIPYNQVEFRGFFKVVSVFRCIFLTYSTERRHLIVQKNVKIFCTASYSHVVGTIRFAIKFHIGLSMCRRSAIQCKIVIQQKLTKNVISRGLKLRRFTQNQINLHSKVFQNHRNVKNSHKAYFYKKTPTHISATYAITNFDQNFQNRIPRESGKNFYIIRFSITY